MLLIFTSVKAVFLTVTEIYVREYDRIGELIIHADIFRVKIAHYSRCWMMTPVREIGVLRKEAFFARCARLLFFERVAGEKGTDALVLSVLSS